MNQLSTVMQVNNEFYESDDIDLQLADAVSQYYADPLGFVNFAFEWGAGDLTGFAGPDEWQTDILTLIGDAVTENKFNGVDPVDPIQVAVSSGHGIGKSALSAWLILWIMSTRPNSKGVVTANTGDQLKTKTMSELAKWSRRCITGHWFEVNAMSIVHRAYPETWRVDALTSREEASESFAGLHAADSTPWYLFDEACHDDQTEVLTNSGWKLFKDVIQTDQLLTMDTDTGVAYYDRVDHLHVSDYNGELLVREGRGSNFAITPNHRMLYYSNKLPTIPQFAEAEKMSWSNKKVPRVINWVTSDVDDLIIPSHDSSQKHYPERTVNMDDWCEFYGWYVTEGHTQNQRQCKGGAPALVVVTQKQELYLQEIIKCVDRMGFKYSVNQQGVLIYDPALCAYLLRFGKGFDKKRVPQYLKDLSSRQINLFLDAAVKGDGYFKSENRHIIYTSNGKLASDYQEMILKTGCNSTVCKRKLKGIRNWIVDHWATSTCDGYTVSRALNDSKLNVHRAKPKRVQYRGKVYCATVSGGVLLTRRNGVPIWSGNSAIPEKIWEVAKGGLTDGEPMHFAFGNPTRNTGSFFECFRRHSHRWITRQIDSRKAKMTNKRLIKQWLDDHGEDSDFFRVRVRGVFPKGGDMQYIPSDVVFDAQKRGPGMYLGDDPLICGVDLARGGDDDCRIQFRRGKDAKSEKTYRISGEKSRDSMKVVSLLTNVLDQHKPDVTFLDVTGLGGPIGDRLRQLGYHVIDIGFGHDADDKTLYVNKTAEMGARCRRWLMDGGAIPDHPQLEKELTSRDFGHNDKDQLVLERKKDMKKRLGVSPDWSDALYLTFAQMVPKRQTPRDKLDAAIGARGNIDSDYNPLSVFDSDDYT